VADSEPVEDWPAEEIPDADSLFFRAHKSYIHMGKLIPGVFRDREGAMSTDWSRHSTAAETRARATKPDENGVGELKVGGVRAIGLTATHTPDRKRGNRAHTDIIGEKTTEVRLKLLRLHSWRIRAPGVQ
jgi:hypothetical protein